MAESTEKPENNPPPDDLKESLSWKCVVDVNYHGLHYSKGVHGSNIRDLKDVENKMRVLGVAITRFATWGGWCTHIPPHEQEDTPEHSCAMRTKLGIPDISAHDGLFVGCYCCPDCTRRCEEDVTVRIPSDAWPKKVSVDG